MERTPPITGRDANGREPQPRAENGRYARKVQPSNSIPEALARAGLHSSVPEALGSVLNSPWSDHRSMAPLRSSVRYHKTPRNNNPFADTSAFQSIPHPIPSRSAPRQPDFMATRRAPIQSIPPANQPFSRTPAEQDVANPAIRQVSTIVSLMRGKLAPEEFKTADKETTAIGLWTALQTRHLNRGLVAQVKTLDEALSTKFTSHSTFSDTILKLTALNKDLWANGAPDPDTFLSVLLLRTTLANYPALFRDINDHLTSATALNPYTSDQVASQILAEIATPTHSKLETANVAAVVTVPVIAKQQRSGRGCSNCTSKGITGVHHTDDYCIRPGGGMEGKTVEEARVKRLADKAAREKTKTKSDEAQLHLTLETSPLESVFDSRVVEVMMDIDKSEYEVSLVIQGDSDVTPKVDWRVEQHPMSEVAFEASIPSVVSNSRPSKLTDIPFLMDLCASIHISND
ncbi:hypothetical protein C8J56DRAFT_892475 [Mycena floridula]|nr:hypothetical protein C8J56DRAFT_892475 [Mycena floridula]